MYPSETTDQDIAVAASEPHDLASLRARHAAGWQPKYLFFWGHAPSGNEIGKECLSQWYEAPFSIGGVTYPTAEHYMMAEKARLFGDDEALREILVAPHPGAAKKLGRTVRAFEDAVWKSHRSSIVVAGNVAKFGQNEELRAFLLGTAARVLVEASPRDTVWGIGLGANNPKALDPNAWRGSNLLGFALMAARAELRGMALEER